MSEFLQALPRSNPLLFSMICRFNTSLAADVAVARFNTDLPHDLLEKVRSSPRGLSKLSEVLIQQNQLSSVGFFDFEPRHRRFALLDSATLDLLGRFTTAAIHRQKIAQLVLRTERAEVKTMLGEDAFMFALKRAEFLVGRQAQTLDTVELPLPEHLQNPFHCFEMCFAGEPPELATRLQLKLPRKTSMAVDKRSSSPRRNLIADVMSRILLSEIAPGLKPCFN